MRVGVQAGFQDLSKNVFNGVAKESQSLLAIAVAPCSVSMTGTVSVHPQKGWGQHARITLRCDESSYGSQKLSKISPSPLQIPNMISRRAGRSKFGDHLIQ